MKLSKNGLALRLAYSLDGKSVNQDGILVYCRPDIPSQINLCNLLGKILLASLAWFIVAMACVIAAGVCLGLVILVGFLLWFAGHQLFAMSWSSVLLSVQRELHIFGKLLAIVLGGIGAIVAFYLIISLFVRRVIIPIKEKYCPMVKIQDE